MSTKTFDLCTMVLNGAISGRTKFRFRFRFRLRPKLAVSVKFRFTPKPLKVRPNQNRNCFQFSASLLALEKNFDQKIFIKN